MGGHNPLGNKAAEQIATQTDSVEDELIDLNEKLDGLIGFNVPEHDEIDITYVTSGNGVGEIETVVYKLSGGVVATLTLTYNGDNQLINVLKS